MKYYPNIPLDQLQEMLPYPQYIAIVPHKDGWLVFHCIKAYEQYQAQTTQGE